MSEHNQLNETLATEAPSKAEGTCPVAANQPRAREADALEKRGIERGDQLLGKARARFQVAYDPERGVIGPPHADAGYASAMAAAFGTTSSAFVRNAIDDLATVLRGSKSNCSERTMNAALALVDGGEPQNEVEAALLIQMAGTHSAAMQCLWTATGDLQLATEGGVGNLAVKLLRTYTAQVEALTKLRRGGEQVVRHIHVDNRGGKAVIAETVNTGGATNAKTGEQSQEPDSDIAFGAALFGENAAGNGVPISRSKRTETMSHARRDEPRGTNR